MRWPANEDPVTASTGSIEGAGTHGLQKPPYYQQKQQQSQPQQSHPHQHTLSHQTGGGLPTVRQQNCRQPAEYAKQQNNVKLEVGGTGMASKHAQSSTLLPPITR